MENDNAEHTLVAWCNVRSARCAPGATGAADPYREAIEVPRPRGACRGYAADRTITVLGIKVAVRRHVYYLASDGLGHILDQKLITPGGLFRPPHPTSPYVQSCGP